MPNKALHLTGRHDGFSRRHVLCSRPASERSRYANWRYQLHMHRVRKIIEWFKPRPEVNSVAVNVFLGDEERDACSGVVAALVVGGIQLPVFEFGPIDLRMLEAASQRPGRYFIWTCWCGDPGCGGCFEGVHVEYDGDVTYWNDRDQKRRYGFRLEELREAVTNAKVRGIELLANGDNLEPVPQLNAEFFGTT